MQMRNQAKVVESLQNRSHANMRITESFKTKLNKITVEITYESTVSMTTINENQPERLQTSLSIC